MEQKNILDANTINEKTNIASLKNNVYQDELLNQDHSVNPVHQELRKWKIVSFLFIGLFIGSLLANFIPPFAMPYSALKSGNLLAFADSSWMKIDEPVFSAYILTDKNCKTCNTSQIEQILRSGLSPTIQAKTIDLNDNLGKKLSADFTVSSLPMIFFDNGVKGLKKFSMLEPLLNKKGDYYNLDISAFGVAPDIFYAKPNITPDHPAIGSASAPLTIVEFIDYQCPFCKRFADQALLKIKSNYVDKGKARIVFKDFPLDFHQNAVITSQAARCANSQGKFIQMHDQLFTTQSEWSNLAQNKIQDYLLKLASKISLNSGSFKTCLNSSAVKSAILEDFREGKEVFKVSGTPGFLVGSQGVSGALPYEEFEKIIEQQLTTIKPNP